MKEIITKSRMILLGKVVVFVVGAIATLNLLFQFVYIMGVVFGLVILVWYAQTLKDLVNWRCVAFLIASTLTGAVVIILGSSPGLTLRWLPWGVLVGTAMLPVAHSLLLGATWKRTLIAIPSIYCAWILSYGLLHGFNGWWFIEHTPYWNNTSSFEFSIFNNVTIWQAAYLVSMFAFRKKEAEAVAEEAQT